jgi:hypothetical protein
VIFRAIGPKQADFERSTPVPLIAQKVPYLGNWQEIRNMAYFSGRGCADTLRQACQERLDGLAAGRAAATVIIDLIDRWLKYDDSIDEVYDGRPVVEGLSPAQQEKRANLFFRWKKETKNAVLELVDKYLACHGISTNCVNDLGALVMATTTTSAKLLTAGGDPDSPALAMLSRAIFDKSKIFNMAPPAAVSDEVVHDEAEVRK